jgi:hypothetical protein
VARQGQRVAGQQSGCKLSRRSHLSN